MKFLFQYNSIAPCSLANLQKWVATESPALKAHGFQLTNCNNESRRTHERITS